MDSSEGSNEERVDSGSAPHSPIPIIGTHLVPEMIRLPIVQKNDRSVYTTFTFPVNATITSVIGEMMDGNTAVPQYKISSPYGATQATEFNERTMLIAGDYSLGFIFESKEQADSVNIIRLTLMMEPISNLAISQMLFTLYKSLGYEPSHLMQYPIQSTTKSVPFYRKTRIELEQVTGKLTEVCTKLDQISTKMTELTQGVIGLNSASQLAELSSKLSEISVALKESEKHLTTSIKEFKPEPTITVDQIRSALTNEEKGSNETVVKLSDIEKLMIDRTALYEKLKEAEDFIDNHLEMKKKKR